MIIIFEQLLIKYCSPVLAGIKTGNLFTYHENMFIVKEKVTKYNILLNKFDVYIKILKTKEMNTLIYVYRKCKLLNDISNDGVIEFLKYYGYDNFDADAILCRLEMRIKSNLCFPHEIGLFLSYPLEDVKSFILHKGLNCKFCGYWKVYCNEENALKCFERYERCTKIYNKLFMNGITLEELVVRI